MSIPSGSDIDSPKPASGAAAETGVPLASLPLVADHQKTITSPQESSPDATDITRSDVLLDTAGPSDVLFQLNGTDSVPGEVRLDHFQIKRRIGSGGMGHVFLAEDVLLHRPVALKVLKPASASDTGLLARFHNEARCAALLRPENIAQVYYIGEDQGLHFIACEYIRGRTVREIILEEETLAVDRVLNYAIQTTLALCHMHAHGVIHRDIKPSNIIVSDEGRVKIVDLGLARRDSPDSVSDMTVAGSILGTFDYIAPEQARDARQADIRSDIYSLGCTMYHMLTGQPPYPEGTPFQKVLDHQGKQAPDPARINSRVPAEVAGIILKMLCTAPEDRYQTPDERLAALMDAADDLDVQGVPADGVVWRRQETSTVRQQSGTLAMLAAVGIVCASAMVMHLFPDGSLSGTAPTAGRPTGMVPPLPPVNDTNGGTTDSGSPVTAGGTEGQQVASVPIPPQIIDQPFVVQFANGSTQTFDSLDEALSQTRAAGRTGHRIMLTFSGKLDVPIRRLPKLDGEAIDLYAAPGARPVLEFTGNSDDISLTSMFRLVNDSSLTMDGITLRLDPERATSDSRWSIFDCSGATQIDLRNCTIQMNVGPRADAAVCRLNDATSATDETHQTRVQFTNVVASGPTDMFQIATRSDAHFQLENCGIAVGGHLFDNVGSKSMGTRGELTVNMRHVTAITGSSLIRIVESVSTTGRSIATMRVTSDAGVFHSVMESGVLVDTDGPGRLSDLTELLHWNGDTNLYSGFIDYWLLTPRESDETVRFSFPDWNRRRQRRDERATEFEWLDAIWGRTANGDIDWQDFRTEWFDIDQERFHLSRELPLYQDRIAPGVILRRLPKQDSTLLSSQPRPGV